jgi:hypothetical protein
VSANLLAHFCVVQYMDVDVCRAARRGHCVLHDAAGVDMSGPLRACGLNATPHRQAKNVAFALGMLHEEQP